MWIAGWERGEDWGQCRRVRSSLPIILLGRQEAEEGRLVKVRVQVLCRFKEVTALEVVTGNVDV